MKSILEFLEGGHNKERKNNNRNSIKKGEESNKDIQILVLIILGYIVGEFQEIKELFEEELKENGVIKNAWRKIYELFPFFQEYKEYISLYSKEEWMSVIEIINEGIELKKEDLFGELYQSFLTRTTKRFVGLFYTPIEVVKYILDNVNYKETENIEGKKIIDLSCGTGVFLLEATKRLITKLEKGKESEKEILETTLKSIYGLDQDNFAIFLAKVNILILLLPYYKKQYKKDITYKFPTINIYRTNSIDLAEGENKTILDIKNRKGNFLDGFEFIVGNPPYIEMKKMDAKTKSICKAHYSNVLSGSFDIFVCFIKMGMDLLSKKGKMGYIIPNKILACNYGKRIRNMWLEYNLIEQIADVSHLPIFESASVYPIILVLGKDRLEKEKINLVSSINSLDNIPDEKIVKVEREVFSLTKDKILFFFPTNEVERNILNSIIHNSKGKLEDYVTINWAVSFHKRGVREQFVGKEKPKEDETYLKFLGGKKYGGNKEIQRYKLQWEGYYLLYDQMKAKKIGNGFPPLSLFQGKKIIICQNSKRIRATIDEKNYICKDIFLIIKTKEKARNEGIDEEILLAFLNSKVISYFYSIIFSGAHVSGGYLHYLTNYMENIPFPSLNEEEKKRLKRCVKTLLTENCSETSFKENDQIIDNILYNHYKLTPAECDFINNYIQEKLELKKN